MPVRIEAAAKAPNTRKSIVNSSQYGLPVGCVAASIQATPSRPIPSPRIPPSTLSITLSTSSCRTTRQRLAPSARADRRLARALNRARQQQVRDVRARDQQDEADGAEQRVQDHADRPGRPAVRVRRDAWLRSLCWSRDNACASAPAIVARSAPAVSNVAPSARRPNTTSPRASRRSAASSGMYGTQRRVSFGKRFAGPHHADHGVLDEVDPDRLTEDVCRRRCSALAIGRNSTAPPAVAPRCSSCRREVSADQRRGS